MIQNWVHSWDNHRDNLLPQYSLCTPITAQLTLVVHAILGCQKQLLIPLHCHKHTQDSKHWNIRREGIQAAHTHHPQSFPHPQAVLHTYKMTGSSLRRRSNESLFPSSLHSFKRTAWSSSEKWVLRQLQTTWKKYSNSWIHVPHFQTQSKLHFVLSQSNSR